MRPPAVPCGARRQGVESERCGWKRASPVKGSRAETLSQNGDKVAFRLREAWVHQEA